MATSPNFSWPEPDNTDLVKNGALAIRTAINAIDTSMVDLKGGTTGQVLAKATNTDMDFSWVAQDDSNAIQNAIVDAKGDIIAATAADTPARLAVGSNNQVLTADSSTATGLKWATPAAGGGGKVLQVINATTTTSTAVSTSSYIDSTLTATITPTLATSQILVIFNQHLSKANDIEGGLKLLRGATEILAYATGNLLYTSSGLTLRGVPASATYLDSPATTSATTYKTQINATGSSLTAQLGNASSTITLLEIGA